jgi:hemin uptake protein HemP
MDKLAPAHPPSTATRPDPTAGGLSATGRRSPPMPRRLHSAELFDGEQQIEIEHGDAVYRLRRTALGKLILTK